MSNKYLIKDNKKYIFASKKMPFLNTFYGITEEIKKDVDNLLQRQVSYLKSHYVSLHDKKFISFYDMSMSANIQPKKYYAEIYNRVSSIRRYAHDVGFTSAVFLTITPPSYLKPLKQINLSKNKIKLVDNPNFCGDLDYVNLAREYMSKKWTKFLSQRIFKDIKKKYAERLIYIRTYEPFIDGTPHIHLLAFIPPEFLQRFVKLAKNYFSDTRFDIKTDFIENIGGVVAYILKYILKSFIHSKNNQMSDISYWYVYYNIRRFVTSRTLIPLKIFRLIKHNVEFRDIYKVTKMYKLDNFQIKVQYSSFKASLNNFNLKNSDYVISEVSFYVDDDFFPGFKLLYSKSNNFYIYSVQKSSKFKINCSFIYKKSFILPVYIYNKKLFFNFKSGKFIDMIVIPSRLKDYKLYNYYKSLDVETCNLHHFAVVKNELIKRGMLNLPLLPIDSYNTNFI